jgi:hypothetical protein
LLQVSGSLCHFKQSIHQSLTSLSLVHLYESSPAFRHLIHLLHALVFVPPAHLSASYNSVVLPHRAEHYNSSEDGFEEKSGEIDSFLRHFEATWLGAAVPPGSRRRTPLYPHTAWNQFETAVAGQASLNSSCSPLFDSLSQQHSVVGRDVDPLRDVLEKFNRADVLMARGHCEEFSSPAGFSDPEKEKQGGGKSSAMCLQQEEEIQREGSISQFWEREGELGSESSAVCADQQAQQAGEELSAAVRPEASLQRQLQTVCQNFHAMAPDEYLHQLVSILSDKLIQ